MNNLIQNLLFQLVPSWLQKNVGSRKIDKNNIVSLEKLIDDYGHFFKNDTFYFTWWFNSFCKYSCCRCVCRRAERIIVQLNKEDYVDKEILIYLNRLQITYSVGKAFTYWDKRKEKMDSND